MSSGLQRVTQEGKTNGLPWPVPGERISHTGTGQTQEHDPHLSLRNGATLGAPQGTALDLPLISTCTPTPRAHPASSPSCRAAPQAGKGSHPAIREQGMCLPSGPGIGWALPRLPRLSHRHTRWVCPSSWLSELRVPGRCKTTMGPATGRPLCVTRSAKDSSSPGSGRGLRVKNNLKARVRGTPSPRGSREPEGLGDTQGGPED